MNNVKILYYNCETIDTASIEQALTNNSSYRSHALIKNGLMLVNFRGSARDLYQTLGEIIQDKSVFIHDLDSDTHAYWGFLNRNIWEWLSENRN